MTNSINEKYINRLIEISSKKLIFLKDMLLFTQKQSEAISENGIGELERIIAKKQEIIDSINKIDEEFNVYFLRLKQELKVKSLDELEMPGVNGVKELQENIKQIMETTTQISETERQNNVKAKSLLKAFGDEINKINQGKKVSSAYNPAPAMQTTSYFIDKKK